MNNFSWTGDNTSRGAVNTSLSVPLSGVLTLGEAREVEEVVPCSRVFLPHLFYTGEACFTIPDFSDAERLEGS
jgi:hypothetical protein